MECRPGVPAGAEIRVPKSEIDLPCWESGAARTFGHGWTGSAPLWASGSDASIPARLTERLRRLGLAARQARHRGDVAAPAAARRPSRSRDMNENRPGRVAQAMTEWPAAFVARGFCGTKGAKFFAPASDIHLVWLSAAPVEDTQVSLLLRHNGCSITCDVQVSLRLNVALLCGPPSRPLADPNSVCGLRTAMPASSSPPVKIKQPIAAGA